jgi:hypothetical protein
MASNEERDAKLEKLEAQVATLKEASGIGDQRLKTTEKEIDLVRNSEKRQDERITALEQEMKTLRDELTRVRNQLWQVGIALFGGGVTVAVSVIAAALLWAVGIRR